MIKEIMMNNILKLMKKDLTIFLKSKSAVVLTYLVPMIIILIFGAVFGGFGGSSSMNNIKVMLADMDNTAFSQKFTSALDKLPELDLITTYKQEDKYFKLTKNNMDTQITAGKRKLGILIPEGFQNKIEKGDKLPLEIHFDPKYQIEYGIVSGIIQKIVFREFPQIMLGSLMDQSQKYLGKEVGSNFQKDINQVVENYFSQPAPKTTQTTALQQPLDLKQVKLLGKEEDRSSMFAQYVAGMAVMFLLFSVTHSGATLLEEKNNGTINRLLITPVKRRDILLAKMLHTTLYGFSQLIVLFIFGWLVFQLNIFKDVPALLIMIVATALACSSLGIFIAAICKNQQQVDSLSTLLILGMSALGGSMFPTIIMPQYIQTIGKFTLNYWAMKGITDIFWYNKTLSDIYPSVLVLFAITIVFASIAIKIFNKKLMR
jgi:ABC-type multidrug transport system permease subunit